MEKEKAKQIAIDGCLWLEKCIDDEGRFIYGYDSKTLKKVKGYNILRHFGSLWSMLEVVPFLETGDQTNVINSVIRSLEYTTAQYITTVYGKPGMKGVVEDGWIKLGGNGLASLCFLSAANLPNLGDMLVYQFNRIAAELNFYSLNCIDNETGLFTHHKRNWCTWADKGFRSGFYPGEALLAMAAMIAIPTEENSITGLKSHICNTTKYSIISYFKLREREGHVRDHWMMQAIERIRPLCKDEYLNEVLIPYANAIKETTITDTPSQAAGPSACRSETLLSWVRFTKTLGYPSDKLAVKVIEVMEIVNRQLDFQAKSIVQRGLSKGAFTHSPLETEVRNDYTQHNISSFIGYFKLLGDN